MTRVTGSFCRHLDFIIVSCFVIQRQSGSDHSSFFDRESISGKQGGRRSHPTLRATKREGSRNRRCCDVARVHRSEEHTSELQSRGHLVCRLLLEKKKQTH